MVHELGRTFIRHHPPGPKSVANRQLRGCHCIHLEISFGHIHLSGLWQNWMLCPINSCLRFSADSKPHWMVVFEPEQTPHPSDYVLLTRCTGVCPFIHQVFTSFFGGSFDNRFWQPLFKQVLTNLFDNTCWWLFWR